MDKFTDNRGVIQDLLGPVDSVTEIFTVAGAVRGNHIHQHTTQWTYVVMGRLLVATRDQAGHLATCEYRQGQLVTESPGIPHAWRAIHDTLVLVFTKGPRSGENYESDTQRLDREDWLLSPVKHTPGWRP